MSAVRLSALFLSAITAGVGFGLVGVALALSPQAAWGDNWSSGLETAVLLLGAAKLAQLLWDPDPIDRLAASNLISARWWVSHWSHAAIGLMCVASVIVAAFTLLQPLHGVAPIWLQAAGFGLVIAGAWLPTLVRRLFSLNSNAVVTSRPMALLAFLILVATAIATFMAAKLRWPGLVQIAYLELTVLFVVGASVIIAIAAGISKIIDWKIERDERRERAHG